MSNGPPCGLSFQGGTDYPASHRRLEKLEAGTDQTTWVMSPIIYTQYYFYPFLPPYSSCSRPLQDGIKDLSSLHPV